jgi:hypothetical protein
MMHGQKILSFFKVDIQFFLSGTIHPNVCFFQPFKVEAQTALFKGPVRTAL